jgi:hypothetical protein
MGDTLNALQAANRSSSVLQGIANPAPVDTAADNEQRLPPRAMSSDLSQQQAQQALGNALQLGQRAKGHAAKIKTFASSAAPPSAHALLGVCPVPGPACFASREGIR